MKQGILSFSIAFSVLLAVVLQAELAVKAFHFPNYKSPFRDVYGMPDIVKRANEILSQDPSPRKALAVTNWTYVSRTMYYNIPYKTGVFLLGNDDERFTSWYSGSPLGADILFITNHFEQPDIGREMKCSSVGAAGQMDLLLHGGKVDTIDYVWCRSFNGINTNR